MFVWSRNSVRESLHISLFCGGDPLCVLERWLENTHRGADMFAWVSSGSFSSVQNYRPYIVFQFPHRNMKTPLCPHIFCLWLVIGTYILLGFFSSNLLIWFVDLLSLYTLAINYILLYFSLSCETTLLMLSCNCIESAKFIHGTLLPAKSLYYNTSLFLSENLVRYSLFLFSMLCKQTLLFPSLPIWTSVSPPMIRTLCLRMSWTLEDSLS